MLSSPSTGIDMMLADRKLAMTPENFGAWGYAFRIQI
jgi:hypothetical protein